MPDSRETGPHSSGAQDTLSDLAPVRRQEFLERGAQVGRYIVLEPVGSGGMSIVYSAYDPELDRRVALKVLRRFGDGGSDEPGRQGQRLLREAQSMARLTHPNVVPIYDVGALGDRVFLAMHFVEGETLGQWLTQTHPWRTVVEFFVYAGRGLAAAHVAGLVHRDFKPDNVLVDRAGRVRVTDFGLARPSEGTGSEQDDGRDRPSRTASMASMPLDRPVTIAGAVLGTPAYMSPEQHLAGEVDARTDQFSFCVALWEALVGERPFAGLTVGELAFAVTRGQMRAFPRDSPVPNRIRVALTRGLSRAPDDRFASMNALLDALAPPARRRTALMVGAGLGLVVLGATIPLLGRARAVADDPCVIARAGLDAIYEPTARKRVEAAMLATGELGPEATEQVLSVLDHQAAVWREGATDACVAHHVDGTQSASAFDARMRCLARRRAEFENFLSGLEDAGPGQLSATASAVFVGVLATACNDPRRLLEASPPPDDPVLRARADEVDAQVDLLLADIRSDDETVALAAKLVADARSTGWHSLNARALAAQSEVHEARGEIGEAERMLREAARSAAAAHDTQRLLKILGDLAYALVHLQNRVPEGLEVAYLIELEIARADGDPGVPAIFAALGAVYQGANQLGRAREAYLGALAMLDTPGRDNPVRRAIVLNNLGTIALTRGDALGARPFFEKALELATAFFGPDYLHLSDNYVNLCESYLLRGELDLARPLCEHALAVVDGPRPRDAAAAARALHGLAQLESAVGNFGAARIAIDRARPLMISSFGEGGYAHGVIETQDANLLMHLGDLAGAEVLARKADAMFEAGGPGQSSARVSSLGLLGMIALAAGAPAKALELCDAGLARFPPEFPRSHPGRADPLLCRGEALVELGKVHEATIVFDEVIGIFDDVGGDRRNSARARFGRAKLADKAGEGARAKSLVEAAREELKLVRAQSPEFTSEVDAWLEAHR